MAAEWSGLVLQRQPQRGSVVETARFSDVCCLTLSNPVGIPIHWIGKRPKARRKSDFDYDDFSDPSVGRQSES